MGISGLLPCTPKFYVGARNQNSSFYDCEVIALSNKASPNPHIISSPSYILKLASSDYFFYILKCVNLLSIPYFFCTVFLFIHLVFSINYLGDLIFHISFHFLDLLDKIMLSIVQNTNHNYIRTTYIIVHCCCIYSLQNSILYIEEQINIWCIKECFEKAFQAKMQSWYTNRNKDTISGALITG